VFRKAGKWHGTNTDSEGVRLPLEKRLRLNKASVLVVGNGGSARSAAFTLAAAGAKVAVTGRNADRVRALAKMCGGEALLAEQLAGRHFDVLVHATPLGMWPNVESCYFDGDVPAELVFDLVYTPRETALLKRATAQGKTVIPGLEMFIEQAVRQFQLFTGENAPRQAMERAAIEALSEQHEATDHHYEKQGC
jgi:3-dehydroquinate dehydratase/shikimate dehydrogenase